MNLFDNAVKNTSSGGISVKLNYDTESENLHIKLRLFEHKRGRSRTPIIALTGHVGAGTKEKCFDAGMDGFLSKPFQEEELLREIERVLK